MEFIDGLKMLGGMDAVGVIIILSIAFVVGLIYFVKKGYSKAKKQESLRIIEATQKYQTERKQVLSTKSESQANSVSALGTGDIPCMAFRPGNIIDWTTIPAPIGETYFADTSCPTSGSVCIVKELENGEVVDYDPREIPVEIKQTPEWAWSATHCKELVKRFWYVPFSIWKSPSLWLAFGMLLAMFIFGMGVIGA